MAQFARPDSTVAAGSWTAVVAATLWEATDEVTANDDTDYALADGVNTTAELGLSDVTDPAVSTGHIVRTRFKPAGSGAAERLVVELFQATTLIAASGNLTGTRGQYNDASFTLTALEADAITNYADLRLKISTTNLGATESMRCTWLELEVPAASQQFQQSLSGSAVAAATLSSVATFVEVLSAGATATASIVKRINTSLVATATAAAAIVKRTAKTLVASASGSAVMAQSLIFLQSLTSSATAAAILSTAVTFGQVLSAGATAAASIVKQVGKSLSASAIAAATVIKQTAKTLIASATASAVVSTATTFLRSLSATVTATATLIADLVAAGAAVVRHTGMNLIRRLTQMRRGGGGGNGELM